MLTFLIKKKPFLIWEDERFLHISPTADIFAHVYQKSRWFILYQRISFYRFVNQSYLVPENIISLSMDGPSVNKLFKEKFESDLKKKVTLSLMLDHVSYMQYPTVSQKVLKAFMKLIWISLLLICTVSSALSLKKMKNILM